MTAVVGRLGVWRPGRLLTPEYAASLEEFGYSTIWVGGSPPGDLGIVERLLAATNSITVATSIVNIHTASADVVAASYARIQERYAGRFVLGIGVGHRESDGPRYVRPYEQVQRYFDDLERFGVSPDDIMLAALGRGCCGWPGTGPPGPIPTSPHRSTRGTRARSSAPHHCWRRSRRS